MTPLFRRHAAARLRELLAVFPVVVLTGARQVGKTTLAQMLVEESGGTYHSLDAVLPRTRAQDDPEGFVATDDLLVLDEVQLVPDLMRAVKLAVDRDRRPGRYLLTGSANLLRLRTVAETLAGRSAWVELGPLTWAEIAGAPAPTAIDDAFAAARADDFVGRLRPPVAAHADTARRLAVSGSMPPTLDLSAPRRRDWYDGYRQTFIERDLRQISEIANLPEFVRLMSLALLRTGGVLNKHELAADASLATPTARRYLNILEVGYQIWELPPFLPNIGKRLTKSPKLFAGDTGLAAHVANIRTWDDAVSMGREGALLETWAINEFAAADRLSSARSTLMYMRRSHGPEVDLVFERGESVVAVEIKSSATIASVDLKGLRALRDDLGDRFRLGIVAHLGNTLETIDRSLCVAPLASLLGVVEEKPLV